MATRYFFLFVLISFAFTVKPQGDIVYHPVKGYCFVGDDLNASAIFLVIHNEKEWKNLFKPYPGHYVKEITNIDWNKYVAIATVKYGNEAWALNARKVELDEGELLFEYEATKTDDGLTWKNASPLVVLVPKGNYKVIKYIENGKVIRKLENFTGKRDY
jgi:hypothetical protein